MSAMCSMLDPSFIHSSVTPSKETLAILTYFLKTCSSSNYQSLRSEIVVFFQEIVRQSGNSIVFSTFKNLLQLSIKRSEPFLL